METSLKSDPLPYPLHSRPRSSEQRECNKTIIHSPETVLKGDLGLSHHTFTQIIMSLTPSNGDMNSTTHSSSSDATFSCRKVKQTIYRRTRKPSTSKCTPKHQTFLTAERYYSLYSEMDHNLLHISMYITPHTPNNNF